MIERLAALHPTNTRIGFPLERVLYQVRNHRVIGEKANELRARIRDGERSEVLRAEVTQLIERCRDLWHSRSR